jgi:hypothetical protein
VTRPVYSTLLIAAGGVSLDAAYVVPAGFTVVVRDVVVFFRGTPEDTAFYCFDKGTGAPIFYALQINPDQFFHLDCHQVFPAGAQIQADSVGPNEVGARVSGYLLTD